MNKKISKIAFAVLAVTLMIATAGSAIVQAAPEASGAQQVSNNALCEFLENARNYYKNVANNIRVAIANGAPAAWEGMADLFDAIADFYQGLMDAAGCGDGYGNTGSDPITSIGSQVVNIAQIKELKTQVQSAAQELLNTPYMTTELEVQLENVQIELNQLERAIITTPLQTTATPTSTCTLCASR